MSEQRIPRGTKATVNGNDQAVVQEYAEGLDMYIVRLWSGTRHVGDVCVGSDSIMVQEQS